MKHQSTNYRLPIAVCLFALCYIALLWPPRPASAQIEPSEIRSEAIYQYGQVMRFSLAFSSNVDVEHVTLFISVPYLSHTLTAQLEVEPVHEVRVEHALDLTQMRLAPFSTVTYWWLVSDVAGNTFAVPAQTLDYIDDQFDWHRLEQNGVEVYWTGDDAVLGQVALDVLNEAMPRLTTIMPVQITTPVRIYLYPSTVDLRAGLRLTGRDWVGAHAHPELGVILVTAANPRTAAADLRQSIPHELSHFLLYQATGVGYDAVPRWFDEGLATFFESTPNPYYTAILQEAVAAGNTIPFIELCHTFPERDDQILLAYAQSVSLIRMIQSEYGNQALGRMVQAFADGADCQSGVSRVLGLSLGELNQNWLRQQQPQTPATQLLRQSALWLALLVAGFLLTTLLLLNPPGIAGRKSKRDQSAAARESS